MHKKMLPQFALAGLMSLGAPLAFAAEQEVTAPEVVGAIEGAFGVNKGERRNHIKGVCALGEFIGTKEAAAYSRSELFSGKPIPVVARFSVTGGNPKVPDTAKNVRGMALQFQLRSGAAHQMAMLNTPMFGAAHPQTFLALMLALKPDPATGKPDPEKMKAFKESHPDNAAQAQYLAANNPPASYANSSYWGIHTFKFVDRKKRETLVRWQFVPQDGEKRLSDDELKSAGANFLEAALVDRTKQGPVRWDMMLTIGKAGDPQDNPTLLWPDDRKVIKAGTLTLSAAMAQKGAACEGINYDPLVMADGIAPTDDPVLKFRSPAYAVSFGKRLAGQ
jgi:catalase